MLRKLPVLLLTLVFLLNFQVGSVFADSKLDEHIDKVTGVKYSYGGTTVKGFDCSGFTQYIFKKLGIELSRSSNSQAKEGKRVAKSDLREGDLVFFNTNGKGISHVGIYIGDGKFAHASTSRGVTIDALESKYYAPRYVTARRVMDTATYQAVATEQDDTPVNELPMDGNEGSVE